MRYMKLLVLFSAWALIVGSTAGQEPTALDSAQHGDEFVPGRIIVEFEAGVLSLPEGVTLAVPDESTVLLPAALEAMNAVGAYRLEKVFIGARPGVTEAISQITGNLVQIVDLSGYFIIEFNVDIPVERAVDIFSGLEAVKSVSPSYYPIIDAVPNDPKYSDQWHLKNTVNPVFDIDAESAWDNSKGDDILIAMIENGVSLGEMQATLLQKVEELTLYVIDLHKENEALKENLAELTK